MDWRYLFTLLLPFLILLGAGIPSALSDPLPALFHPSTATLSRALSAQASQRLGLLQHHAGTDYTRKRPSGWEDLELLDTVLVGTVDGGLHALERSTGRRIWSRLIVGKGVVQSHISNETWRPTVKIVRETEEGDSEIPIPTDPAYIVDPYDGQLYVQVETADGGSVVQKLPLTMEQLIDLSPFTFPQEQSHVFIGSRSTSLLAIDLQTGKSISSYGKKASIVDEDCLKHFEAKMTERSLEDGDNAAKEKIELAKAKCSKSIEERMEDKLLIGRTDYHLSIHAGMNGRVQDLSFTKLVPNSAHKELAEYWRKNGNVKGEVYVSERSRSRNPQMSTMDVPDVEQVERDPGERIKTEVEMENRWRIEVLHDGTIVGIEQGNGVRWHNSLPSIAVSVYDVLLPTSPGSQPILLPQPPAYVPTLFGQETLNLQLLAMPASTYISRLPVLVDGDSISEAMDENDPLESPVDLDQEGKDTAVTVFATSSDHCPLILLAPRAKPNELLGGHVVEDAVKERLPYPYLLDASNERGTVNRSEVPETNNAGDTLLVDPALVEQESSYGFIRFWTRMWNRWWFWSLMMIVGFSILLLIFDQRLRRLAEIQMSQLPVRNSVDGVVSSGTSETVISEATAPNGKSGAQYSDPEKAEMGLLHGQTKAMLGKKSNGRRRRRGKRKSNKEDNDKNDSDSDDSDVPLMTSEADGKTNGKHRMLADGVVSQEHSSGSSVPSKATDANMEGLTISEEVLGFGSHGTVVYKGVFQGRAVAVKRLLQDFVTIASQEVSLLQASDDHQNVVRYFCQEKRDNFLYIALELCPASLADVVEQPELHQELAVAFDPKKALYQVTAGLRHLHGLKIIHRDIKPQNVLISIKKNGSLRMMLSDFGLAKRLDHGQSSYIQTGKNAIGSVGWRAPECLRGDVQLDDLSEGSTLSGSLGDDDAPLIAGRKKAPGSRLTKAVDLFALGCLYFYALTAGHHPYGDRYEREVNIIRNEKVGMAKLDPLGEDGHEAGEILDLLLSPRAEDRPDTSVCLVHPLFWSASKRLAFLCDASDRFEIMELQPPEPTLILLENKASAVVGQNWQKRLDTLFLENLGKHRKYDGRSVRDLLRALRNKKNHYQDLPPNVQRRLGTLPAGFLSYFTSRFPALFTHVHNVVSESKLRHESMFAPYFDIDE